jgi:hypothetical protein
MNCLMEDQMGGQRDGLYKKLAISFLSCYELGTVVLRLVCTCREIRLPRLMPLLSDGWKGIAQLELGPVQYMSTPGCCCSRSL